VFAARIRSIWSDLTTSQHEFADSFGGLASPRIEGALADFDAAWSQRRGALLDLLDASEHALVTAADHFSSADASLAGGLAGGGSGEASASA